MLYSLRLGASKGQASFAAGSEAAKTAAARLRFIPYNRWSQPDSLSPSIRPSPGLPVGKLYNFVLGVVVGFFLYHAATNYHLVYANDGVLLVAKVQPRLAESYVDVRSFTPADWVSHPQLAVDLQQAGKGHVITGAAADAVNNAVEQGINQLLPQQPPQQ
jgi:hypothetical protein